MRINIWFIRSKRTWLKGDKRRRYYITFLNSIERVFNLIKFIDKKYIRFNPSNDYKKSVNKEEWKV